MAHDRSDPALANKIIHPFSDFLLHDVGTGDGIVQNGGPSTREQDAHAAAVGRAGRAGRLMHDGESVDAQRRDSAARRRGDAGRSTAIKTLSTSQKNQLVAFLRFAVSRGARGKLSDLSLG